MTQLSLAPEDNNPMNDSDEREITLGTGKMLALFFGLVILCAVFFGMGYSMGRSGAKAAAEPPPAALPAGSPASEAAGNPSPGAQTPAAAKPGGREPGSPDRNPSAPSSGAALSSPDRSAPPGGSVGEALADAPAKPGQRYFVQIAAVTKQEDAEALVESLKGRQYEAFIANASDQLFHVQLGPFPNMKDAEAVRTRLMSDGYNPILKK